MSQSTGCACCLDRDELISDLYFALMDRDLTGCYQTELHGVKRHTNVCGTQYAAECSICRAQAIYEAKEARNEPGFTT